MNDTSIYLRVSKRLRQKFPQLKDYKIEKATTAYLRTAVEAILDNWARGRDAFKGDLLEISFKHYRTKSGRTSIDKQEHWNWTLLQGTNEQLGAAPLFSIVEPANRHKQAATKVQLATKYRKEIKELMDNLKAEKLLTAHNETYHKVIKPFLDKHQPSGNVLDKDTWFIQYPIDQTCLRKAMLEDEWTEFEKITGAMILELAEKHDGKLPMLFEKAQKTDRMFGKGINLQTCPKKVRKAAIGYGHQYDLNAAAFAIINHILDCPKDTIHEYVKNKRKYRKIVTRDVYSEEAAFEGSDSMERIKEAFTAIGFGAQHNLSDAQIDNASQFQAITRSLKPNAAHKFLKHPFVKDFIADWEKEKEQIDGEVYVAFQNAERKILEMMMAYAEQNGANYVLPVHDSIITDVDVGAIAMNLMFGKSSDVLRVEYERIKPLLEIDGADHRMKIAREERMARGYSNRLINPINT